MNGKVYLVGAGPGDPGLISVKGKECITRADVLVYDYLASPTLLAHADASAEMIYVGKKGGDHTMTQDEINALLVREAGSGRTVTRLKGGDPFIFGRGGEEAEVLIQAGIPFEIVPGVTSAIAAPAYAGIPLTHRKFTSTLAFITGHEDPGKETSSINWEALAKGIGTLVFLMGVRNLPHITRRLMDHGRPPDTPVALVRWGTTPSQQTVTGTLETIAEDVKAAGLTSPSVIVVGDVVTLRESMKWFESRPLFGKKIVVTRARQQASDLVKKLSSLGADCVESPTIKIVPPTDTSPMDMAIEKIGSYDWVVFTSVNGVISFFQRLFEKGRDARSLGHIRTAAIGPVTSAKLLAFGINSDIVPESFRAESVVDAFTRENVAGKKILLPRAEEARPVLPVELAKMGAVVDEVTAYHTRAVAEGREDLLNLLEEKRVDTVTFTSSSTVKNFRALLPPGRENSLMKNVVIASIGPITTRTAVELGFKVQLTAETYTIEGLCEAIVRYYERTSNEHL